MDLSSSCFTKFLIAVASWLVWNPGFCQSDSLAIAEIQHFQQELNEEYVNPETSPLEKSDIKKFKGHDFFAADLNYRVASKLTLTPNTSYFNMKTSKGTTKSYRVYGLLAFTLNGKEYSLPVYQSADLLKIKEYEDYLFFPFTDQTNSEETYGGGRYIELRIPVSNEMLIDFNKAYNPYCAYSNKYACPIVPSDNHLDTKVLAGVRLKKETESGH